ncbi:uncharacterized protein [Miscanthus floridulus]|uniref:uncharacterized protein isoform X1 n=1 Tax=Miscanthus floridulus TaxID=154761 RepID=UPI00345A07D2
MTTSGAPKPPTFKRSSSRNKSRLRSRGVAAGGGEDEAEAEAAGTPALARALLPASVELDAVLPVGRALPREFFEVDALDLAPRLLGKLLRCDDVLLRINEVEAYRPNDSACHGRFGVTARTAPVFGPGGHAYVYLCYGLHMMLNVVADIEGVGAAVLIRSCSPVLKLSSNTEVNRQRSLSYLQDQERLDKLWAYPPIGRTILSTHLVGWRYWTGQNRRAFWLVPALASSTHLPSMSRRRGGSPSPARRGSAPPKIRSGRAEDLR